MKLFLKILFSLLVIFPTNISEAKTFSAVEVISEITSSFTFDEGKNNDEFRDVILSGDKNLYLYNGTEYQEETGWYDYHARMYDASIGRWMVADPLGESFAGLSPYSYVLNNPINYTDPTGMYPSSVHPSQFRDHREYLDAMYDESMRHSTPDWVWNSGVYQDYLYYGDHDRYRWDVYIDHANWQRAQLDMNRSLSDWNAAFASVGLDDVLLPRVVVYGGLSASRLFEIAERAYMSYEQGVSYTRDIPSHMTHLFGPNPYRPWDPRKEEWRNIGDGLSMIPRANLLGMTISLSNAESGSDYGWALAGIVPGLKVGKYFNAAKGVGKYSDDLVKAAQKLYPNKAGKIELHHITPNI